MPDFIVRFKGDLGNLAQFDRAVQNSIGESSRALQAANLRVAQAGGAGPITALTSDSGVGRFVAKQKTQIDSLNRTFIQSGEIVRRYISGYEETVNEANEVELKPIFSDEYLASFNKVQGNYDRYLETLEKTQSTERAIAKEQQRFIAQTNKNLTEQLALKKQIAGKENAIKGVGQTAIVDLTAATPVTYSEAIKEVEAKLKSIENGALTFVQATAAGAGNLDQALGAQFTNRYNLNGGGGLQYRSSIENDLLNVQRQIGSGVNGLNQPLNAAELTQLQTQAKFLDDTLKSIPGNIEGSKVAIVTQLESLQQGLATQTAHITQEIEILTKELDRLKSTDATRRVNLQQRIDNLKAANPAYGQLAAATNSTPPINADLQRALENSKQLRNELIKNGLGAGARYDLGADSQFAKNLAAQDAQVTKFEKNLRTGVTNVQGSIREFNAETQKLGAVQNFTADIDKNGKVITRWGGQLSGTGNILRQTVRDFQKVIEWTVATTAVFGSLGLAISSLKTINDLNTALTRFSITSQTSIGEAKNIFSDLGKVAIDTATPLVDLVKVADDIALATKSAGDSSEEWRNKIIDLTTAVGIFTNLTGTQTVEGADKLSSAFKQLGLAPKDLVNVLNKVTAVAGGQSTAINDIVTALGGVGEAGKAAGLSLDQQIALVQVLGQVTNKSAADTATAFKNLFGAVSSPGSEKILKEFGIDIRDSVGGLRPFLDIYRDINKAVLTGIIPANRYQDVLRGISGGPRRAPDAAALLGNLPLVEEAITRSVGASNEALVANAKILDTNQAKITQLQNKFDIAIFQKFGDSIQKATAGLAGFLSGLLDLFNKIDPSTISLLLTLGAIVAAAKVLAVLGGKIGPGFLGSFVSIGIGAKNALLDIRKFQKQATLDAAFGKGVLRYNDAGRVINQQGKFVKQPITIPVNNLATLNAAGQGLYDYSKKALFGPVGIQPLTQVFGKTAGTNLASLAGGAKGVLGAGLGIGSLIALSKALTTTNQDTKQTIGQMLQLGGAVSIATGVFAPLGIAATIAGTALQIFNNNADDATVSAHDNAVAVSDAITQLKTARENADAAQKSQADAQQQLNSIIASGKKDKDTKDAQTAATRQFVDATFALADANRVASESYDDLLKKIPALGDKYKDFANIAKLSGPAQKDAIDRLSQNLASSILGIQGKNLFTGPLPTSVNEPPLSLAPSNQKDTNFVPGVDTPPPFDKSLFDPNKLKELFDTNLGTLTDLGKNIPITQENLAYLSSSIDDIIAGRVKPIDLNQTQIDTLVKTVNSFLAANSTSIAFRQANASDEAQVQALTAIGALSGDKLQNSLERLNINKLLEKYFQNAGTQATGPEGPTPGANGQYYSDATKENILKQAQSLREGLSSGVALSDEDIKKYAQIILELEGEFPTLKAAGDDALRLGLARAAVEAGVDAKKAGELFGVLPEAIMQSADAIDALQAKTEAFKNATDSALQKYAARNLDLINRQNSGDFKGNSAGLAALQAQSDAAYKSEIALKNAIEGLSEGALGELEKELAKVNGLQDATTVSGDKLAAMLVDEAIKAGVSAKGILRLQQDLNKLLQLGQVLSSVKAVFNIDVNADASQAIRVLQGMYNTIKAFASVPFIGQFLGPYTASTLAALQNAINALKATGGSNNGSSYLNDINSIIGSGKGSNLGSSGSGSKSGGGKSGPDVSTLDLPDEIANASNRSALIQQAIKMARELQSKVPGATKDAKNDIVELLKGTQRILEVRGIKDDYLRKALEELAAVEKKRLEFETKADTIRRIRVGSGSFAALANVPLNNQTGVSVGSPNGPISINLNINGQVLTPAQFQALADQIAAAIKRQIGG